MPTRIATALRLAPVAVLAIGVAVHAGALLGLKADSEPLWTDVLFLLLDGTVGAALLRRRVWGYWAAVALFLHQSAVQSYSPVSQLTGGQTSLIQLSAAALAVLMAALLLMTRQLHLGERLHRSGSTRPDRPE